MSENNNKESEKPKTARIYLSPEDVIQLNNLKFNVLQDQNTKKYYIETEERPNTKNPNVKTQGITQEQLDLVTRRHIFIKELQVIKTILLMFKDKKDTDLSEKDIQLRDVLTTQLYYIMKYLLKNKDDFKLETKHTNQIEVDIQSIETVAQFCDFDLTKYQEKANERIKQLLDQLIINKDKDKN